MNDEIVKLLAERRYNKEHISDWAIKCLEKGYDSKSLRMLSSMSDSFISLFELDTYFERSMKELGWDEINIEDYLLRNKLKLIDFNENILRHIGLFDQVLEECGESPLLENKNFSTFLDFITDSSYLVLEAVSKKENTIPIVIWFENESLRIDIEGMSETFEWAKEQIDEAPEKVVDLIRVLFTGYISIETRRSSRFVQIFDSNGFFDRDYSYNNLFHMITGRYISRQKDYRRLYLPMFSKK